MRYVLNVNGLLTTSSEEAAMRPNLSEVLHTVRLILLALVLLIYGPDVARMIVTAPACQGPAIDRLADMT